MRKRLLPILLGAIMTVCACTWLFAACAGKGDKKPYFEKETVFYLDLTMRTGLGGPLSDVCNPGTLTFKPNGDVKMNVTFSEQGLIYMDTLLGFRIPDFVHDDTYELNEEQNEITYHPSRESFDGEAIVMAIETLADGSMKFVFNVGKVIPNTSLTFYSNEAMLPANQEKITVKYTVAGENLTPNEEDSVLPAQQSFTSATEITLPELDYTNGNTVFRGWRLKGDGRVYQPGDRFNVKESAEFEAFWDTSVVLTFVSEKSGYSYTSVAECGATIVLPANSFESQDGKKGFAYWQMSGKTYKYYPKDDVTVTGDTTFTAVFNEMVTLTFEPGEEGRGVAYKTKAALESKFEFPVCWFSYGGTEDKGFGGWQWKSPGLFGETTKTTEPGERDTFKRDTVVTALWENYVTVSYTADGGTGTLPDSLRIVAGIDFTAPACNLTKEGFAFGGWKYGTSTKQPGAAVSVKVDTAVVPVWKTLRTVSFDTGIEGKTIAPVQQGEGLYTKLPEMPYENGDKMFGGWKVGTTSTIRAAGYNYSVPKADITLHAVWYDKVQIAFVGGEEASGSVAAVTAYPTTKIELPENGFTRSGYEFGGWSDGKKTYQAGANYTVPVDGMTLNVVWLKIVEVAFSGGEGAVGSVSAVTIAETKKITLPENGFTKENYDFSGWTDGSKIYQPGDSYTVPVGGITLNVAWADAVTLNFAGGAGATGSVNPIVGHNGKTIVLPDNGFTMEGKVFVGWTDGTANYMPGDDYTIAGTENTVTIEAIWVDAKPYSTEYDAVFRAAQTGVPLYTNSDGEQQGLNAIMQMTQLVLRADSTADFEIRFLNKDADLAKHAAALGFTVDEMRAMEVRQKNISYLYDATTGKVTLNLLDGTQQELTLTRVPKSSARSYDSVEFTYTLPQKIGGVETLVFAAIDGKPAYLSEQKVFKARTASYGEVTLTINPDGTGSLKVSIMSLNFAHAFTPDMKTLVWYGDEGDRLEAAVGENDEGKMTIAVSLMGMSITLTEQA